LPLPGAVTRSPGDPADAFCSCGNQTTGYGFPFFQINATTGGSVAAPSFAFSAFNLDFAKFLAVDGRGTFLYVGQGSPFLPIYAFSIDKATARFPLLRAARSG
jgi:hypothetical protein